MYTKVWLFGELCLPLHPEPNILSYDSIDNERFQKQPGNIV